MSVLTAGMGLGGAESGLITAQGGMSVLANDVANSMTPGFESAQPEDVSGPGVAATSGLGSSQGKVQGQAGSVSAGAAEVESSVSTSPGPLAAGTPTALALNVPAYFPVRTGGGVALTTDGQFSRNANGQLVTPSGAMLLGLNQRPVTVPESGWSLANGAVLGSNGQVLARLALVTVPNPGGLASVGGSLYAQTPESGALQYRPAVGSDVTAGYYNASNTNLAQDMAGLVADQGQFLLSGDALQQAETMAQTASRIAT